MPHLPRIRINSELLAGVLFRLQKAVGPVGIESLAFRSRLGDAGQVAGAVAQEIGVPRRVGDAVQLAGAGFVTEGDAPAGGVGEAGNSAADVGKAQGVVVAVGEDGEVAVSVEGADETVRLGDGQAVVNIADQPGVIALLGDIVGAVAFVHPPGTAFPEDHGVACPRLEGGFVGVAPAVADGARGKGDGAVVEGDARGEGAVVVQAEQLLVVGKPAGADVDAGADVFFVAGVVAVTAAADGRGLGRVEDMGEESS